MRVLGVDPGTFKMGVGIIEHNENDFKLVHSGVLKASKNIPIHERLNILHKKLLAISTEYKPVAIAVEHPFVSNNVKTAMAIGQAQSLAMIIAASLEINFFNYMPTEVKKSVTDYGLSSKSQVHDMVKLLLKLPDEWIEKEDASDALAVAICHVNTIQISSVLNTAEFM